MTNFYDRESLVNVIKLPCQMEPYNGRIVDSNDVFVPESYIVHCVNNHERLVEALRGVLDTPRGSSGRIIIEDDEEEELATLLAHLDAGKGGEL